jgi:hypothetical protein
VRRKRPTPPREVKHRFTTALIVVNLDPFRQFGVEANASDVRLVAVLSQRPEHPFIVWTDHKYLRTTKRLNSRQVRGALLFFRFKLSLSYRPGSVTHASMKRDCNTLLQLNSP